MDRRLRRLCPGTFITVLLLIAVFLPVLPQAWGSTQPSLSPQSVYSSTDWTNWAATAWKYYQPGVGVNSATGLHRASTYWHCFTDWDLGSYIYSIIYARKLNLIVDSGTWGFSSRVTKVLNFLSNRPLSGSTPYIAYDWATGQACSDTGTQKTGAGDAGRLLAALYALETYSSGYASTVNSIFARSRSTYNSFALQVGSDYYSYAVAEGYAGFGYNMAGPFSALDNYAGSYQTVNGQSLPLIKTTAEPIDHVILEADLLAHPPSASFLDFGNRVYLAQSARYTGTSPYSYVGWSEGGYPSPSYIYEWILVYYNGGWQTWILGDATPTTTYSKTPAAFVKVAFSYLAIYGENPYTLAMVDTAKTLLSTCSPPSAATLSGRF